MTLQLHLQTPKKPFLAEGAMPLTLCLRNVGGDSAQAPSNGGPSQFVYIVLSEDGARTIRTASARQKQMAGSPGLTPQLTPEMRALAPGSTMIYGDDLGALLDRPIEPGRYLIEAGYRLPGNVLIRSDRVPFEVVVSSPAAIAQTLDAQRKNLITVDFHRDDAVTVLRKRDGGGEPFRTLHTLSGGVGDASIALEAEDGVPAHWRWVAWLDGSALFGGVARMVDFKYPRGPIDTGLESPSLLPVGYGFRDGRGMFVITGMEAGRKIRLLTLPPGAQAEAQFRDVQLANLPYASPDATMAPAADGAHEMILSWTLRAGNSSGLVQGRIDPATGEVKAAPKSVFTTDRPIAAAHFPALLHPASSGIYQLLLAPKLPDGPFTLVRIDAGDVSKREERDLPDIAAFECEPVDHWILPSHSSPRSPVVAVSGGKLWMTNGAGAWRDLRAGGFLVPTVRLWSLRSGEFLCTWFDPQMGYAARGL